MTLKLKNFLHSIVLVIISVAIVAFISVITINDFVDEISSQADKNEQIEANYFQEKQQELIAEFIFVIASLSLIIFFLSWYFIKKEILMPLRSIQDSLHSILNKNYQPIHCSTSKEIQEITASMNTVFLEFSRNYSALQSYQESVNISNIVTKTDLLGKITYANELFCQLSEYTQEEVIGKPHSIVRHPDMDSATFQELWKTISEGNTWRGVVKNRTKSGGYYWTDAVISPVFGDGDTIVEYISIRRDITELMDKKATLEFKANYDELTKLLSRDKLHSDITDLNSKVLVLININRFSQINDFYGIEFGDRFLVAFAQKLQELALEIFGEECLLYRNGGDEFALLFQEQVSDCEKRVEKLLQQVEKTVLVVDESSVNINLSCGISFEAQDKLLHSADIALKISKQTRKDYEIYAKDNAFEKSIQNNILWSNKLVEAIENDRIVPFFQPIVNNTTLEYEKYESLIRLIDSEGKVVSPFFFLDVSKQTKHYSLLTKIMIDKSFAYFKEKAVEFSLNLTIEDIGSMQLQEYLFTALENNKEMAHRIVFEIVESESISDYSEVIRFIDKAKSKGCKIAIDDFGSGYSNFEYLIKLQADYIKIDGSLIKNIATHKESFIVTETIVSFAKQMGIKTIAEFIENEEILKKVQELGIDYSQGYYFSAPTAKIVKSKS